MAASRASPARRARPATPRSRAICGVRHGGVRRARPGRARGDRLERTLREGCEQLAPIDTTACSPGEREAAEWIAARLRRAGVDQVALEEEPSWGGAPPTLVALGALGMAGAALVLANRRMPG